MRRQTTSAIENERGSFQPPIGNCVPVRNLSRTNSRRPFSRKCVPPNRIKGSLFSLQSEQRNGESAAIHRDERADLPAAHSPREQPPRETIRKNPKQFGTSRYEKEPDNQLSLPSKICGGERGIRTPGPLRVNGFQDRRDRPLRHLSSGANRVKQVEAVLYDWCHCLTWLTRHMYYTKIRLRRRRDETRPGESHPRIKARYNQEGDGESWLSRLD